MMRILLIALALLGIVWLLRGLYRKSPRQMYQWLGILLAAALIVLVLAGRAHWLFAIIGTALPFLGKALVLLPKIGFGILRFLPFINMARRAWGGGRVRLHSQWLEITLDRANGQIHGTVLQGEFKGRELSALSAEQLQSLYQACQQDPESLALLRAYLQRTQAHWQPPGGTPESDEFVASVLSTATAAQILGVLPEASESEIQAAYRHLAQKLHPDRGGNDYLAQKINQARDVMLKHVRQRGA